MSFMPQIKIELDASLTKEEKAEVAKTIESLKTKGLLSVLFNAAGSAAIATYAPARSAVVNEVKAITGVAKVTSFNPMSDGFDGF